MALSSHEKSLLYLTFCIYLIREIVFVSEKCQGILKSNVFGKNFTGSGAANSELCCRHTLFTKHKLCNNLCGELTSELKMLLFRHFAIYIHTYFIGSSPRGFSEWLWYCLRYSPREKSMSKANLYYNKELQTLLARSYQLSVVVICVISTGGKANPQCSRCGPRTYSKGNWIYMKGSCPIKSSLENKIIERITLSEVTEWKQKESIKGSKEKENNRHVYIINI